MSKNAIVVLTRGYDNLNEYNDIIERNISIYENLINKSIPIIIFHEGNILLSHQEFIKEHTPLLLITFIDVRIKNMSFLKIKENLKFDKGTENFKIGYRHMCSFWFVNFWDYCNEYDNIIRIDEDCIINFNIDKVFNLLNSKVAVYGKWENDADFVTKGLNNFTLNFLQKNIPDKLFNITNPSGPYTNIIGLNLSILRQNIILTKYIEQIKYSDCIYIYRWGDLPLWGEVLKYLYNSTDHLLINDIKYFHKSHNIMVN